MAKKDNPSHDPAVNTTAGPVPDATTDITVEQPWGEGKEFKTERDYIQSRVKQAREESQAHLNKTEPVVETLPGAAEDVSGKGKPIGSGESWSSPDDLR